MFGYASSSLVPFIGGVIAYLLLKRPRREIGGKNHAVFITGCDTGLGYSIALHCRHKLGLTVIAGCLNTSSEGARNLEASDVHVVHLDVTDTNSVKSARTAALEILKKDPEIKLKTIVNNAAVMIFGEFAWLTESMICNQVQVNLLGAMFVFKAFVDVIRENKGRIINVASHCALQPLPGLSVYSATKAALLAWTDSIRVELNKYGASATVFIPGSFPFNTSIMLEQKNHADLMKSEMQPDGWTFYQSYFRNYMDYLNGLAAYAPKQPTVVRNRKFYSKLEAAICDVVAKRHYRLTPPRYAFYHGLAAVAPTFLRDKIIQRFVNMPQWRGGNPGK